MQQPAKVAGPGVDAEFVVPRRRFWMNAWPVMIAGAVRSVFKPRIGRNLAFDRP